MYQFISNLHGKLNTILNIHYGIMVLVGLSAMTVTDKSLDIMLGIGSLLLIINFFLLRKLEKMMKEYLDHYEYSRGDR